MKFKLLFLILIFSATGLLSGQSVTWPADNIIALTADWEGERFPDGRPKISDNLLERLKGVSMEEAWATLRKNGYMNQFENFSGVSENSWEILHPDQPMTGRAVTAQYTPARPDLENYVQAQGKKEKNPSKISNYSPISVLVEGDIYVADGYGKMEEGTLIGDNLGNAIWNASKRGFVFNGSIRDVEGNLEIEGMNGWFRGSDPSAIKNMMLSAINGPIRIGRATILPGDAVLAKKTGVVFIPSHLVAQLVISGEVTALQDEFTHMRINDGTYEYKDERFVGGWSEIIDKDFVNWAINKSDLPMPKSELKEYLDAHPRVNKGN